MFLVIFCQLTSDTKENVKIKLSMAREEISLDVSLIFSHKLAIDGLRSDPKSDDN